MTTAIWDWDWKSIFLKLGLVCLVGTVGIGSIGFVMEVSSEEIEQDEYGVVTQGNDVVRTVGMGNHYIIPLYESMHRVQKNETVSSSVSSVTRDGVGVEIVYESHLKISQDEAGEFYRRYGNRNIEHRYSGPCTRASLRTEVTKHSVESLFHTSSSLENATMECESGTMSINVTKVNLPHSMDEAIRQKRLAGQNDTTNLTD